MTQHIPRKELKKDQVRETLAHGAEAILAHERAAIYVIVAVALIAAAIFGWRTYSEHQTVKAFAAFDAAMKVFQTPVGPPQAPGEVTYLDQNKKFTEANQKFSEVSSKYPHTRAGELSGYYVALTLDKLGKNDEAKKRLQGLVNSSDADVAALSQFELAELDDRTGQNDEAVRLYKQLIAKPTTLVPKAMAMMALADHYSAKDPTQAADLYKQIKTEYPDTPMSEQADQALALLPSKS